jgi:hypothetical protein
VKAENATNLEDKRKKVRREAGFKTESEVRLGALKGDLHSA